MATDRKFIVHEVLRLFAFEVVAGVQDAPADLVEGCSGAVIGEDQLFRVDVPTIGFDAATFYRCLDPLLALNAGAENLEGDGRIRRNGRLGLTVSDAVDKKEAEYKQQLITLHIKKSKVNKGMLTECVSPFRVY